MTEHKNIYTALCAAQANMGKVTKGSINPAFKSRYADLADVVSVVVPALSDQGIAMYHSMIRDDEGMIMRTTLSHGATDTHIHCDVPLIVDRNNMQGMKSATTYAKRIGLESLTGIAPDTDDDGNAAAKAPPKQQPKPPVEDEMAWFKEYLPKMSSPEHLNSVMMRAKSAGREVAKLVADRANELGFDFDPDQRCYVDLQAHRNAIGN
jgi:hypothetical protein